VRRPILAYGLLTAAAVLIFLLIRAYGETLAAPAPGPAAAAHAGPGDGNGHVLFHVLLALGVLVIVGQTLARLFAYVGQPPVIGEVVAGIVLGPSLLGRVAPEASAFLLPPSVAPFLGVIAQLGVVLYMFLVGLELNAAGLRDRTDTLLATSNSSIVVPFLLGAALALYLYPRFSSADVPFTSFALFLGVALSITAFPVLARILTDRGMQRTPLGALALACAATGDVTAWCLLALVVGVAQAQLGRAVLVAAMAVVYVALMFLLVRPVVARLVARLDETRVTRRVIAAVFVGMLLSALATELIGVHALFGAFLAGAVIPHESPIARAFIRKLEDVVTVLLLPAFFALTGMRTQVGLVSGAGPWLVCGLIILVATAGKFGGACVAARLTGVCWRESAALGVLMNTRGLMELIVLNIGLEMGVISPTLFAMLVLMALATTLMTSPLLHLVVARPSPLAAGTEALRPADLTRVG
jgi:Kef-type K+ transport system membrane component KefB